MFCFEISDLANSFKDIKHVSIEKFNWFSFYRKNYLSHPEIPLDDHARQLVLEKFNIYPTGKIFLLTHLSCLGYCINPISLYFIYDENNQALDYLIIEVTNTPWGEKHNYILKSSSQSQHGVHHFKFEKALHVSPFMAMDYEYQFNLKLNKQNITIHMENHKDGKKDFDATLMLTASAFKQKEARHYLPITYKVAMAIYWQAFKLWIKAVSFYAHPKTK